MAQFDASLVWRAMSLTAAISFVALTFSACALPDTGSLGETRSIVDDISKGAYQKIVVSVESLSPTEKVKLESNIVAALSAAGLTGERLDDIYAALPKRLTEAQKADLIQKSFSAVLYVNVVEIGLSEKPVDADHNNSEINFYSHSPGYKGFLETHARRTFLINDTIRRKYVLNSNGSVSEMVLGAKVNSDLQDTQMNQKVWTAETIVTLNANEAARDLLFQMIAKQLVEKLRADTGH